MNGRFVKPEVVVSHFHVREGDKVADFGAGAGNFAKVLSLAVGGEGVVYLFEVQKNLVESCESLVQTERLNNVEVVWSDFEEINGTKIDDGVLDVALMVNTLFQLEDGKSAISEVFRTLRSGGKFFLIDWSESFGGLGPQPDSVVLKQTAIDMVESVGFVLEREFDSGDHHYGLALRKP